MTAVLDWSMDLLEPEEVDLFERLAVFSGGFSLDAVEAVALRRSDDERADVLPALGTLVDQSLVLRVPSPDDQPRFRLLEPVRQYAMQRLHASGQATATADRHAAHFHARATAFREPLQGPDLGQRARPARGRPRQPALGLPAAARARPRRGRRRARRQPVALPRAAWPRPRGAGLAGADRARGVRRRALPGADRAARPAAVDRRHRADAARDRRGRWPWRGRVADPAVTCEILMLAGLGRRLRGRPGARPSELLARGGGAGGGCRPPWVAPTRGSPRASSPSTAGDLATAGVAAAGGGVGCARAGQPVHPGHRAQRAAPPSPSCSATSRRPRRCSASRSPCRSTPG